VVVAAAGNRITLDKRGYGNRYRSGIALTPIRGECDGQRSLLRSDHQIRDADTLTVVKT